MRIRLLLIGLIFSACSSSYACGGISTRVYAGDISYSLNPNNPLNCSVTITLDFDIPDNLSTDSIFVDWGDGYFGTIFATSITPDSTSHLITGAVLYKHVYQGNHTYAGPPANGFYLIAPTTQYRLSYASNIINGQQVDLRFYIAAQVAIDSTNGFVNHSPVLDAPGVALAYTHHVFNQPLAFVNEDEDSVVFDLLTPLVNDNIQAPAYLFPNQYCQNTGQSGSFSINHVTGEITWDSPCQQGIFAVTRVVSKYRNGHLLGTIMCDQNIFVSSTTGFTEMQDRPLIQVYPNPANGVVTLQIDKPALITIYDMLGKPVMQQSVQPSSQIDLSALSSGTYFMRDDKNTFVARVTRQ